MMDGLEVGAPASKQLLLAPGFSQDVPLQQHRNTPSRGFLEADAWLVVFQLSVCYNCSLLFWVLASIKILAEGRVGIGGRRRVTTRFSWPWCFVFLLQGIVELGCKENLPGVGVHRAARGSSGTAGPEGGVGGGSQGLAPPGVPEWGLGM